MSAGLFSSFELRGTVFRNRIVMPPMLMYSCINKDGAVTPWHITHYKSRAEGGAGLIMLEASAVRPDGRLTDQCMGIWSDAQLPGLRELIAQIQESGAKAGVQLFHAGRKSLLDGRIIAPSAVAFSESHRTPEALTVDEIQALIGCYQAAARRAREAGIDVIEIHGAHGYLLNEFLSPLANRREDEYGGGREGRFRLLGEVIGRVRAEWDGPLFVRFSLHEYAAGGNTMDDMVAFAVQAKALGADLIDCSSGGVVPANIEAYPGYQVPYAETVRNAADIPVGAVGLITEPGFADHLIRSGRADLIFLGRELLRNPYWPLYAAKALGVKPPHPKQYDRVWR